MRKKSSREQDFCDIFAKKPVMMRVITYILLLGLVFYLGMNWGKIPAIELLKGKLPLALGKSEPEKTKPSSPPSSADDSFIGEVQQLFYKKVAQPTELKAKIQMALFKEMGLRAGKLKVDFKKGTATVEGELGYPEQKALAERIVKSFPQVKKVELKVKIVPPAQP